jgi:hypothetical protein
MPVINNVSSIAKPTRVGRKNSTLCRDYPK